MLDQITPLVLTFNEEANIGRTLARLTWAPRVVVVDSHSTDRTLEIVRGFPNVEVVQRAFDTFASQWNFGLKSVRTAWSPHGSWRRTRGSPCSRGTARGLACCSTRRSA